MAIGRISGPMLRANLERQGVDLSIETDLLYVDVNNNRIGINQSVPTTSLQVDNVTVENNQIRSVSGALDLGAPSDITISGGNSGYYLKTDGSGNLSWAPIEVGDVNFDGNDIPLSFPDDSSLYPPGAITDWTFSTTVTNAIDDLNEALENVRNNTFVKSVTFTGSPTAGGEGTTVTLSLSVVGNANRYDIVWGDGNTTTGTTDSTPSHTYTSNSGSPYTVTVTAYNNGGEGTGSTANSTRTDYIVIYTADPVAAFDLYNVSTGGSALTGNNLYVIEGDSLYLDNNTTNTTMADVTYEVNWGDGSTNDTVANDSVDGGVSGSRLQHTWGVGTATGTGRDTVTLTLDSHTTADPSVIPTSASILLKVYDPAIAAPDGLSTKTIGFSGTVGTLPRLASGFTDNTSGATYVAGDDVNRSVATTGTIESTVISTFAYDADNGTLTASVNGTADGNKAMTSGDDTGTYTSLIISEESDYNLLNSSGSSITFANSIYHPALYSGFKAKVAAAASGIAVGVNSFQLQHSTTGNTNIVEFVKDDLTTDPSISNAGTLSENTAGTYRYISGIPYYNSGSPNLTLSGVTVSNLVGQCYTNQSNIVEVDPGTNYEGTSASAIASENYSYAQIDGASTMLSGGIPTVNVGTSSPYALGNLTVDITSSSVRTVEAPQIRARNVNGIGSYSAIGTKVAVHTAAQSGVNEIAIPVADSLGNGTYTDDGVRIFDFSAATTDTPTYNSATNFYTNSPYTESSDPGVTGTQEATIRLGVLKHDVTDYSTGFLPAGPDRSGDTGTQYLTFAFRRQVVANFDINITSSTGISGMWIAAPGTAIDSASTLNGWLDTSTQYAGSGVPGADTGNGGNSSNGCAFTGADVVATGTSLSGGYTMTLGSENMSNATSNVVLVRIALSSGESVTALSIGEAS
jgi:3D (Asp-Asp-Asp) domain-containing protein